MESVAGENEDLEDGEIGPEYPKPPEVHAGETEGQKIVEDERVEEVSMHGEPNNTGADENDKSAPNNYENGAYKFGENNVRENFHVGCNGGVGPRGEAK
ncbi:hypothetical protein Hanom_Chr08g00700021 [Helianthus anomalus]